MKKLNWLKLVCVISICALLVSAAAVAVFATDDQPTLEIAKKNIMFGEKIGLMFAIKASDDVSVSAVCGGDEIGVEFLGNQEIEGETYRVYQTKEGWAAQNINAVVTVTAVDGEQVDKLCYSVLMYLYERLNLDNLDPVEEADRIAMYEALLVYAKAADKVINNQDGRTPNDLDSYNYVEVVGGTIDGYNSWGLYKTGATPFADVQHNLVLGEGEIDRWSYSVDGVGMGGLSLGGVKALEITGDTIVTASIDKAHTCIGESCTPVSTFDELVAAVTVGGCYYLTNDISVSANVTFAADATLCLNGKKLDRTGDTVFTMFTVSENVTLKLVDCGDTERVGYIDPATKLWTEGVYLGEEEVTVVTLYGGVITKGMGAGGRAISSYGTLITTNINFAGNFSTGEGAAINSSGTYTDNGSVFVGNTSSAQGATLRVSGKTTLNGTKFIGNSSTENRGGAILASGSSSKLEATECYFDGNTASTQGGAVALSGITDVTITECTFTNNSASRAGALYITGDATATTISCLFEANSSAQGGAISAATGTGYTDGVEGQTDKGSTFKNNTSTAKGGAIDLLCAASFYGTKFEGNSAVGNGGAINTSYALTLDNCTFTSNEAAEGGAIHTESVINVNSTTFDRNTATGDGAAIYQYNSAKTNTLINVTLTGNSSGKNGVLYIGGKGVTYIEGMKATDNYSKGYAMIYATTAGNTLIVNSAELSGNTYKTSKEIGFIQSGNATAHIQIYKPGIISEGLQGEEITDWDSVVIAKNSSTALDLVELEEPATLPEIE